MRDRQIDVVALEGNAPAVVARIPVKGNPNRMVLNRAGSRLYVASDNADVDLGDRHGERSGAGRDPHDRSARR